MATLGLGQAIYEDVAVGIVNAGVGPTFFANNGFSSLVRLGVGQYELGFPAAVPVLPTLADVGFQQGVGGGTSSYKVDPTGTKIAISTFDGGALADIDFSVTVRSIFPLT